MPTINNFSAGELSPRLAGRWDIPQFNSSCRVMENFLLSTYGEAEGRPGLYFSNEVKFSAKKTRVIPFIKNLTTAYILEFGDLYIRVYKNGAILGAPYEIVTTYVEADLFDLQIKQYKDELWIFHKSYAVRKLTSTADTTWALTTVTFTAGAEEETFNAADHYPACGEFTADRLILASTNTDQYTWWGSKSGDFTNFTLGATDPCALKYTLPTRNRIKWILSKGKILIFGTGGEEFAWDNVLSVTTLPDNQFQSTYGSSGIQAVIVHESALYVQRAGRKVREYFYNQETNDFVSPDLTILSEHVTAGGIVQIAVQDEPQPIVWFVTGDGELIGLTFEKMYNVVGWHRHVTDGEFESVAVIPGTDEDQIYVVVKRMINGATKRYVEYFKPRNFGNDQTDCFFVDSGITFDGGTAKTITGATKAQPVVITSTAHGFSNDYLVRITDVVGMTELNNKVFTVKNVTTDTFQLYLEDGSAALDGRAFTAYTSGGEVQRVYKNLTGLSHLEAKVVSVLADGAAHPTKTVASGNISLDRYANKVHVGLQFIPKLQPQKLIQGRKGRIDNVTVRFYKTLGCEIGPDADNLETMPFRSGLELMGEAPKLFTGDRELYFNGGFDKDGNILIQQEQPFPITIQAIIVRMGIND